MDLAQILDKIPRRKDIVAPIVLGERRRAHNRAGGIGWSSGAFKCRPLRPVSFEQASSSLAIDQRASDGCSTQILGMKARFIAGYPSRTRYSWQWRTARSGDAVPVLVEPEDLGFALGARPLGARAFSLRSKPHPELVGLPFAPDLLKTGRRPDTSCRRICPAELQPVLASPVRASLPESCARVAATAYRAHLLKPNPRHGRGPAARLSRSGLQQS